MSTNNHTPLADPFNLNAAGINPALAELDERTTKAPTSYATNTLKLAATGLIAGVSEARITGEANRLERYMGGGETDDANWEIIGANTFELILDSSRSADGSGMTINGVDGLASAGTVSAGWVKEGVYFPLVIKAGTTTNSAAGFTEINGETMSLLPYSSPVTLFIGNDGLGVDQATMATPGTYSACIIGVPNRGAVSIHTWMA